MRIHAKLVYAALIFAETFFLVFPCEAAFQDSYWSARAAALGGAFTVLCDDPSGIFYNSAAMIKIKGKQAHFNYAKLYAGLDEVKLSLNQFAYAQSFSPAMVAGVGWGSFDSSDLYREDTVVVSCARSLKPWLEDYDGDFSFGISVRYLTRKFTLDDYTVHDPVFADGERKQTATFDLHFYSIPEPNFLPGLSLGVSIKSLNEPDIGFCDSEKLPREIVAGLLYRWKNFSFPLDISHRAGEILPHVGSEITLMDEKIALRFGSDTVQAGNGFGYQQKISEKFSLVFDYAFLWPLQVESTAGSHRATLGVKF